MAATGLKKANFDEVTARRVYLMTQVMSLLPWPLYPRVAVGTVWSQRFLKIVIGGHVISKGVDRSSVDTTRLDPILTEKLNYCRYGLTQDERYDLRFTRTPTCHHSQR